RSSRKGRTRRLLSQRVNPQRSRPADSTSQRASELPGARNTSVRCAYRAPPKQAVGSGKSISAPPSSTRATVVDAAPREDRNTRVGPWEETNARAPGPTDSSSSSRSPFTSPPPSVLVYAHAAVPWLRGDRKR